MPAFTRSVHQGLLLSDPRWVASDIIENSTVTEYGPLPGAVTDVTGSSMRLETLGTVTVTADVDVRAIRGGNAGPDGGAFVWRTTIGSTWRGWDGPFSLTSWEYIDRQTSAYWQTPQAVALDDGTVLAVACKQSRYTMSLTRSGFGSWGSEVEVFDGGTLGTLASTYPCLVKLSAGPVAGRVLCYHWVEVTSSTAQVYLSYTDDGGATWVTGQRGVLPAGIDLATYTPKRLRAAESGGRVLLLAEMTGATFDEVHQYASSDIGVSFTEVDVLDTTVTGLPAVAVVDGVFVVVTVQNAAASVFNQPHACRLGTPFAAISDATDVTIDAADTMEWAYPISDMTAGGSFTSGEVALWLDPDGTLYLAGIDADDDNAAYVVHSDDGGRTWTYTGHGPGAASGACWWRFGSGLCYPAEFSIVSTGGQALVVVRPSSGGSAEPTYGLHAVTLGGYSTVTLPQWNAAGTTYATAIGWSYTWLPWDLPDSLTSPFTASSAGSPTVAEAVSGVSVTHGGVTDYQAWTASPTSTLAQGLIALLDVDVAGSVKARLALIVSDATHSYDAEVQVSTTSIVVRDTTAGTILATETTGDGATGVQLLVAIGNTDGGAGDTGKLNVWYRPRSSPENRGWTLIHHSSTLQRNTIGSSSVSFGTIAGAAAGSAKFRLTAYAEGAFTGSSLYQTFSNPADLIGRQFSVTGAEVTGGLRIASVSGPALTEDRWTITPRAEYPLSSALPDASPSPAREWRSADDAVDQTVNWTWASNGVPMGPVFGLYCGAINWRTATLYQVLTPFTKTTAATIDSAAGQDSLDYVREGDTLLVDADGDSPWWSEHELSGAHVDFGGGVVRRIRDNSAGAWLTGTLGVRIVLEGSMTGVPSSGTCAIMAKDIAVLVPTDPTASFEGYQLVIDGQDTADGVHRTGVLLAGVVFPFASQYSWGRASETGTLSTLWEGRSGVRRAQRLNARARRAVELPWDDEVRQTPIMKQNKNPDPLTFYSGGSAWGVPADTLHSLAGIVARIGGPVDPVVFLPAMPSVNGTPVLSHPQETLYGRVRTDVLRLDQVQGTERQNEVWRGPTVRIEEEL